MDVTSITSNNRHPLASANSLVSKTRGLSPDEVLQSKQVFGEVTIDVSISADARLRQRVLQEEQKGIGVSVYLGDAHKTSIDEELNSAGALRLDTSLDSFSAERFFSWNVGAIIGEGLSNDEIDIAAEYYLDFYAAKESFVDALRTNADVSQTIVLEDMGELYANLRTKIEAEYEGEEKETHIRLLDRIFEYTIESVAGEISEKIFAATCMERARIRAGMAMAGAKYVDLSGKNNNNTVTAEFLLEMAKLSNSNYMAKNLLKLAEKAKQFFMNEGGKPQTIEERKTFEEYISKDTSGTAGDLSYGDIKYLLNSIYAIQKVAPDNLSGVMKQIRNSSASRVVKNALELMI